MILPTDFDTAADLLSVPSGRYGTVSLADDPQRAAVIVNCESDGALAVLAGLAVADIVLIDIEVPSQAAA